MPLPDLPSGAEAGDDHDDLRRATQPQPRPQRVGVDVDAADQDLDRARIARRKRLAQYASH